MNIDTQSALLALQRFGAEHRRTLVAAAVVLLAGTGITALAVAPLVADAPLPAQRLVSTAVQPQGIAGQLDALANEDLRLSRNGLTRGSDTANSLLDRLGVNDPGAAAFLRSDPIARQLLAGRSGKMVQVEADANGALTRLVGRYPCAAPDLARTSFNRLTVARVDGHWQAKLETAAYGTHTRLASGTIRSSLFAATDEAGLPDAVAGQLAKIFSTDIDFHRELRRGDTFSVVYDTYTVDGQPVAWSDGAGRIEAAEFVNGGQTYHAVWFAEANGRGAYYDIDGMSKRRAFLASPVAFSRITSGFAMRFHPIFGKWKKHNGVDYAAPIGTPVHAVGDGVVAFAGRQNGYGNVVMIQHSNGRETVYAHLSRIDVRRGQKVQQGLRIGAVGMTGWATGPHLHFELRIHGVYTDPLRIAKSAETTPIDAASRPRFAAVVRGVESKLAVAETLGGARNRVE
ncbi:MAG: M23 family metallopeptidase [Burkholderiales bacterium]|nr:M23 family metallopeptidase [Burkholderiales bacterium]MDE1928679.1 M23 family metallopeptidase [Burkholderiales bacterium]MDE2160252.1 M23 family metallopeptidase [Burkholderiales bacterium]MDE2501672.1 M23 family metallopeptidase [Burkholderiales bacterium]